jgi:hypothetical protein
MTQDELLTRITIVGDTSIEQALLAVVKMHEPIWRGCDEPSCCGSEDMCRCGDYYPCDTIQAIEKELG